MRGVREVCEGSVRGLREGWCKRGERERGVRGVCVGGVCEGYVRGVRVVLERCEREGVRGVCVGGVCERGVRVVKER